MCYTIFYTTEASECNTWRHVTLPLFMYKYMYCVPARKNPRLQTRGLFPLTRLTRD